MDRSSLIAAREYRKKGLAVVPIPHGRKGPILNNWCELKLGEAELDTHFPSGSNIGLILGKASGGLVDIDCDVPEASVIAQILLPFTDMVHGRSGNQNSHFYFLADPIPLPRKFSDPSKSSLIEIRSDGQQTLVPPSIHPSDEPLRWTRLGNPSHVDGNALTRSVAEVAAATLLARSWPAKGQRNDAANAVAGMLLLAGWSKDATEKFVAAVAVAAHDEEERQRVRDVVSTADRLTKGKAVTGAPTLAQIVGPDTVTLARNWLRLESHARVFTPTVSPPTTTTWPEPLAQEALYGVAGEIVRDRATHRS